jgi:single-strand DNA-binding protein
MNKVVLVGRLARNPEVRYSQGEKRTAVGRYTLAVERRYKRDNEPTADFIPCVVFGKSAEFVERYFHKGMRVSVSGRIQTGNYTNKEGNKVHTPEVFVEEQEFAESKGERQGAGGNASAGADEELPWMDVPEGIDDELPFH